MRPTPELRLDEPQSSLNVSRALTWLALGGAVAATAVIVAPHVLPALGIGDFDMFEDSMWVSHTAKASKFLPITEAGSGLAGIINRGIANYVPFVGQTIAAGGWPSALTSGVIGVGGVLLGTFVERRDDGTSQVRWGKLIRYAAIAASALVALPTLLGGLTMGLTYLAMLTRDNPFIDSVVGVVNSTLGISGGKMHAGLLGTGAAAAIPHLLGCGVPMMSAAISLKKMNDKRLDRKHVQNLSEEQTSVPHVEARMETDAPLETGKLCNAKLILLNLVTGQPLTAEELAVTHTEKIHLFVADESLKDYHHIHPRPTAEPGVYAFSFTPKTGNDYAAWADVTLRETGRNYRLKTDLPARASLHPSPQILSNTSAQANGLNVTWSADVPLAKNASSRVEVEITDAQGRPVRDLEPVMGAYAHLVGFSADGASLIHAHPLGAPPQSLGDRGGPRLTFDVLPENDGPTQFYLQIKHGGKDLYVPFGQHIRPPARAAEKLTHSPHSSHLHP